MDGQSRAHASSSSTEHAPANGCFVVSVDGKLATASVPDISQAFLVGEFVSLSSEVNHKELLHAQHCDPFCQSMIYTPSKEEHSHESGSWYPDLHKPDGSAGTAGYSLASIAGSEHMSHLPDEDGVLLRYVPA